MVAPLAYLAAPRWGRTGGPGMPAGAAIVPIGRCATSQIHPQQSAAAIFTARGVADHDALSLGFNLGVGDRCAATPEPWRLNGGGGASSPATFSVELPQLIPLSELPASPRIARCTMLEERLAQAGAELVAMRERAEAAEKRERDAVAARQQQQQWQPQHSPPQQQQQQLDVSDADAVAVQVTPPPPRSVLQQPPPPHQQPPPQQQPLEHVDVPPSTPILPHATPTGTRAAETPSQRWRRKVEDERRPLSLDELSTLSGEAMRAYASAMGIVVARKERSVKGMTPLLRLVVERCWNMGVRSA